MKVIIEIECDNDAFGQNASERLSETERVFRDLVKRIEHDYSLMDSGNRIKVYDSNGNACGFFRVED